MQINVKYFGRIAEIVGVENEGLEPGSPMTVASFRSLLFSRCRELEDESFKIAVDMKFVTDDYEISEDCEVAILPPFAGG